jgi:hypothetical protein
MSEFRAYSKANRQTLPFAPPARYKSPVELKAKNKRESKLFAHIRRMRLTRTRQLFPTPPRPYFPPIRVNHQPKAVHVTPTAHARTFPERVAQFLLAAAQPHSADAKADGAIAIAASEEAKALPASASASSVATATPGAAPPVVAAPDLRFAVVDVNSKQQKVVEGDLVIPHPHYSRPLSLATRSATC